MDSTRQQKIARLLQKELGEILRSLSRDITLGAMLTVTVVRISPDLSVARVYVSIFPSEKSADVLSSLRKSAAFIRMQLAQRVRYQLRIVPETAFFVDDSLDYAEHIEDLLSK